MREQPAFGPLLAEGKTKLIYAYSDDDNLAYMVNKDQITAGDGAIRTKIFDAARRSNAAPGGTPFFRVPGKHEEHPFARADLYWSRWKRHLGASALRLASDGCR